MLKTVCSRFVPVVVAVVLAVVLPSSAQFLLDDLEHGSGGPNKLGGYWYTFNSHSILTNHVTPFAPTAGGYGESNFAAEMRFSGLTNVAAKNAYATVGMGTNISGGNENVGYGDGFNDVTGIRFWARGPAGLVFNFNVETIENAQAGSTRVTDNSYTKQFTIPTTSGNAWALYTVVLIPIVAPSSIGVQITGASTFNGRAGDLAQEPHHGFTFAFKLSNVTQISWSLKSDPNTVGSGAFAVDDVQLLGDFTPVIPEPADLCKECVRDNFIPPTPNALLSNFDAADGGVKLANELCYYWYSYNDAPGGTSTIAPVTGVTGRAGQGYSVYSDFTMGAVFGGNIPPFAGIGTDLYRASAVVPEYLNALNFYSGNGGFYFEYKTEGMDYLKFEVHDEYSVDNTNGKDFYVRLPGTGGEWKSAVVNFDTLKLPKYPEGVGERLFNPARLAKLQFVNSGGTGTGSIAVDNVYFYGANKFDVPEEIVVVPDSFTLAYTAGAGGVLRAGGTLRTEYSVKLEENQSVTVTAEANQGFEFDKWSDGIITASRTDFATKNITVTANFIEEDIVIPPPPPPADSANITYSAGAGGTLVEILGLIQTGLTHQTYTFRALPGTVGPTIKAEPNDGYRFLHWNDNFDVETRTDTVKTADRTFIAVFTEIDPDIDPGETTFTLSYAVGSDGGGSLSVLGQGSSMGSYSRVFKEGVTGYAVTAVPDPAHHFVGWSDDKNEVTRTDIATKDLSVTANFLPDIVKEKFTLTYTAGMGGKLRIGDDMELVDTHTASDIAYNTSGPAVNPIPNDGYVFVGWNDNWPHVKRTDANVRANVIAIANFELATSVASFDRVIPEAKTEIAAVTPITVFAGEFAVGPNPVPKRAGEIKFFWTGRAVGNGRLTVYDASGNIVKRIRISDKNAANAGRRTVGAWNLTGTKGRPVAEGTYLVKGVLTFKNGGKEKVSAYISVTR